MTRPGVRAAPRTAARAAGRSAVVGVAVLIGAVGVRILAAVPGYGRARRRTIALQMFSRLTLRALGVRMISNGAPRSGPALVVANHVCWLDVLVLTASSAIVPLIYSDVLQRSSVGPMASRAGALMVRPGGFRDLAATVGQVTDMLRGGHRVLVFPECGPRQPAATTPRNSRDHFSRAVFQAAVDAAVVITPVALSYSGPPVGPIELDGLFGSLWRILRAGPMTASVTWLPVIAAVAEPGHRSGHREAAARRTEWAIGRALGERVSGCPTPVPLDVRDQALALS